jgi:hypothetical protein
MAQSEVPRPLRAANSEAMRIQALGRQGTPDVRGAGAMLTRLSRDLPVDPMASMYAAGLNEQARRNTPASMDGVGISGRIMRREVTRGLAAAGALGGTAACESTGAHVAQGILGATAGTLTTIGSGGFRTETAQPTYGGVTGSNISADSQRNLQIAGAAINIVGSLYAGICDARMTARGIESPGATQTLSDWRTAAIGITSQVQDMRQVASTSTTPSVPAAETPASTVATAETQATAETPVARTWLYVAGGVAALAVVGWVASR